MKIEPGMIAGVVNGFLKKHFSGAAETPQCHHEWWDMCCSDSKFVAIAAPRGHAKSTAITLAYTITCILFRERKFVLIVSDTEAQSALFLGTIKSAMTENEELKKYFRIKGLIKETETDIIIQFEDGHLARIIAKGSEQKLRGLNWNNLRPDLIIGDDMENDEIVMNKERREKFRRWFTGALLPCKDKDGVIRLIGTILHMDSLLSNYTPKEGNPRCPRTTLCIKSDPRSQVLSAKYKAHPSVSDFSSVLWPDYKNADWLKYELQTYKEQGLGDMYAQEYLNQPLDDSNALFRKTDFSSLTKDDMAEDGNYYVGMDLAVTKEDYRDHSAFVIGRVNSRGMLEIRRVIKQRMDANEIVEMVLELNRIFKPSFFVCEKGTIINSILPQLKVRMQETGNYALLHTLPVNKSDKIIRSTTIRARMRAGGVKFDKDADWFLGLEEELLMFPRLGKDDQVDALSLLGLALDKFVDAPTQEELDKEAYEEEYAKSGLADAGRNAMTGY